MSVVESVGAELDRLGITDWRRDLATRLAEKVDDDGAAAAASLLRTLMVDAATEQPSATTAVDRIRAAVAASGANVRRAGPRQKPHRSVPESAPETPPDSAPETPAAGRGTFWRTLCRVRATHRSSERWSTAGTALGVPATASPPQPEQEFLMSNVLLACSRQRGAKPDVGPAHRACRIAAGGSFVRDPTCLALRHRGSWPT